VDFSAPHIGYVIAAYAVSGAVIGALATRIVLSLRALQLELKSLEEHRMPRRKAPS
jgi:hypothetical protein